MGFDSTSGKQIFAHYLRCPNRAKWWTFNQFKHDGYKRIRGKLSEELIEEYDGGVDVS